MAVALSISGIGQYPAFAADGKIAPFGNVSYSTFI